MLQRNLGRIKVSVNGRGVGFSNEIFIDFGSCFGEVLGRN